MLFKEAQLLGMQSISLLVHDLAYMHPKANVHEVAEAIDAHIAQQQQARPVLQITHQPRQEQQEQKDHYESVEWKEAAAKLYDDGKKPAEIAEQLNLPLKKVANYVYTKHRHSGGKPRTKQRTRRSVDEVATLAQAVINLQAAGKSASEIRTLYQLKPTDWSNLMRKAKALNLQPEDMEKSMLDQLIERGANS